MSYADRVLALNPLAYWRLNESSGTWVADSSGNGYTALASGVTWGVTGIGDSDTAARFNSNAYINIYYSAGLGAAFDGAQGAVTLWFRGPLSDLSSSQTLIILKAGVNDNIEIYWNSAASAFALVYKAGGVTRTLNWPYQGTGWHALALVWDKDGDEVRATLDDDTQTLTGLGTWAGALSSTGCYLGTESVPLSRPYNGELAHVALWDRAPSDDEVQRVLFPAAAPLVTPITDRTLADIQARSAKAFWNVADWERVIDNSTSIRALILDGGGLLVDQNALSAPTVYSFPKAEDINQMVENIELLRVGAAIPNAALKHDYTAGLGATAPDFVAVNAWESAQAALYSAVPSAYAYCPSCGATVAGQPRAWERG